MPSERTYHDPLHGAITLLQRDRTEALLIDLIDTAAFQRLRRIRQLGPVSLTFHGAEGSRFTHSLGVMAIARRAFDRLCLTTPQLLPYRAVVLCGALLHDIGHGPLSHTGEELFHTHHEAWTARIINDDATIRELLDRFDPTLRPQILQVYQKSHPIPCIWQLISSQLDCDRLDYLMRDSYCTGASYGHLDLDRILLALRIDPATQQLVVAKKGLAAIEHYLTVRSFMYQQVYNHGKTIAATWMLDRAIQRARELFSASISASISASSLLSSSQLPIDETLAAWLQYSDRANSSNSGLPNSGLPNSELPNPNLDFVQNSLTLTYYLAGDDTVLQYHLQRWQTVEDPILSDLCRRWCDRDLLKAQDISAFSSADREARVLELQARAREQQSGPMSLAPTYYIGLRVSRSRGYSLYQKGINLQTEAGLVEISERSPLIRTLNTTQERCWLIAPRSLLEN